MGFFKYKKQIVMMQAFGLAMGVIFPLFAGIFVDYKPSIPNALGIQVYLPKASVTRSATLVFPLPGAP